MMKFETVEKKSIFTSLDFRTKLVMMAVVTIIAFVWESPVTGGFLTFIVGIACVFAGVKSEYLSTVLKVMIPFYILIVVVMGFFNVSQVQTLLNTDKLTPIFSLPKEWFWVGGLTMNQEGIVYGLNIVFKTLTMVLIIPLGIFTTDVNDMVVGMVKAKISYKIVFIFSSTLRFFPLLLEEIQGILEAQRLRGLALEKMSIVKKVSVYATIAVPLILNAMAKSQKLEVVLQSKAFSGSSKRTYLHESILTSTDYVCMVGFISLFIVATFLYFYAGVGKFPWLLYS
ncbi:energy-coupling factor transporter transmembrane component T family protein [Crocosphaera sp. Alani8]|uniref:energy-coupling factor transporter transmembrane component T family protein n=1 Tax=Crocosphaera sp. Alani8 TaxID=3038952 RepID=UPI00313AD217